MSSFHYDFQTLKNALLFNTQEIIPNDPEQLNAEIQDLVDKANVSGEVIRHYIGFEISGQIHLGTGLPTARKIKALQDAGVKCTLWLADYHTFINGKLDGKIATIRAVASQYFAPIMLECCRVVGCQVEDIEVLFAEQIYDTKRGGNNFLSYIINISKELTLNRVIKSVSIAGKTAGESVEFSTLMYPVMQVADAFFLQTHIVHAGLDQRKAHVLMRDIALKLDLDYALKIDNQIIKPIAVHQHLLQGLLPPTTVDGVTEIAKMSKSKPDSAIWVHDSAEEINRKLKKAYCPMPDPNLTREQNLEILKFNPLLNWCQRLILPASKILHVTRPEKFGGNINYVDFESLQNDYLDGKLHPMDLKNAVASCLSAWLEPIRIYTEKTPKGLELVIDVRKS